MFTSGRWIGFCGLKIKLRHFIPPPSQTKGAFCCCSLHYSGWAPVGKIPWKGCWGPSGVCRTGCPSKLLFSSFSLSSSSFLFYVFFFLCHRSWKPVVSNSFYFKSIRKRHLVDTFRAVVSLNWKIADRFYALQKKKKNSCARGICLTPML